MKLKKNKQEDHKEETERTNNKIKKTKKQNWKNPKYQLMPFFTTKLQSKTITKLFTFKNNYNLVTNIFILFLAMF